MILYDYHMHSHLSPDGKSTMEKMCLGAIEKGLKEVAFTDHYEFYAHGVTRKWFHEDYLKEYFRAIEECQREFQGRLRIRRAMEFGQLHLDVTSSNKVVDSYPFDFVLGSIHKIENVDLGQLTFTKENAEWIGDAYYYHLLELSEVGNFDCLAHMDFFKKHCARAGLPDLYEKYQPIIKKILENVIKRGKGIEVNTACMGNILEDTMPGSNILSLYKELGGTIITAGSDAHRPERIAYGFLKVQKMLQQQGFTLSTYSSRINQMGR